MTMLRLGGLLAIALTLTVSLTPAAADEAQPPLLEALAFVPGDAGAPGLDFIDWAQLKALHGGAGVTGASPLSERQRARRVCDLRLLAAWRRDSSLEARRYPMLVFRTVLTLALVLVMALPAAGSEEDSSTPLLEAMAYLHPKSEPITVDFIDWAQLKRLHGGEDITSASPLQDRQRLLLDVARAESVPIGLGLDLLATWPEAWGWDNTDLDWQARYWDGRDVLRFGEHWDPAPFRAALESRGYQLDASGGIEVWLPPAAEMPMDLRLERVGSETTGPEMFETFAAVTISADGRTVMIIHPVGAGDAPKPLRRASRPNLERIAHTPAVRAAAAMGNPVAADVVASGDPRMCVSHWEEDLSAIEPEVATVVEGLHVYQARAGGYGRETVGSPTAGRFVFVYERPRHARKDLPGRVALLERGPEWHSSTAALPGVDARVEDGVLILDVEPVTGAPGPFLMGPRVLWAPFAMCASGR